MKRSNAFLMAPLVVLFLFPSVHADEAPRSPVAAAPSVATVVPAERPRRNVGRIANRNPFSNGIPRPDGTTTCAADGTCSWISGAEEARREHRMRPADDRPKWDAHRLILRSPS